MRGSRRATVKVCEAKGCKVEAIPGRIICDGHAYPAEHKVSGRRQAIEAQKKAKALAKAAEEERQTGD